MTQAERDAILGKAMRGYQEAKNRFGELAKRSKEIAAVARALADALERHPDSIHVSKGKEGAMDKADARYIFSPDDAQALDPNALREHLRDYVSVKQLKEELRQKLIALGQDDPES